MLPAFKTTGTKSPLAYALVNRFRAVGQWRVFRPQEVLEMGARAVFKRPGPLVGVVQKARRLHPFIRDRGLCPTVLMRGHTPISREAAVNPHRLEERRDGRLPHHRLEDADHTWVGEEPGDPGEGRNERRRWIEERAFLRVVFVSPAVRVQVYCVDVGAGRSQLLGGEAMAFT